MLKQKNEHITITKLNKFLFFIALKIKVNLFKFICLKNRFIVISFTNFLKLSIG